MFLFNSDHDDALITLCRFDHATFRLLLGLFDPLYDCYVFCSRTGIFRAARLTKSGKKLGRKSLKRVFTSSMLLGLVLAWNRTRGSMKVLQMIFAFTVAPLSRWLRYGRRLLVLCLRDHPATAIKLPTEEELATFRAVIGAMPSTQLSLQAGLSEWGMEGFRGSFPRLKDRFLHEEIRERKIILIPLLYNY